MQIDFYEEFPTEENLERLRWLKYPLRLFIAANSPEEFGRLKREVKRIKKDVEICYWPIINNSYWISPFSHPSDLNEAFHELESIKNHLLIDLELPKDRRLIKKNWPYFFKNKSMIKKFLEKNKDRITTAEVPASILSRPAKFLGLSYNIKTEKSLMWYSSMNSNLINNHIKSNLKKIKNKNDYSVSIGTIAIGILGNESILPPSELKKDLEFVAQSGFNRAIIFRLGGLNKEYIKIIESSQN